MNGAAVIANDARQSADESTHEYEDHFYLIYSSFISLIHITLCSFSDGI